MESKSVDGRFVQTPNERRIIELLKKRIGRKASAAELAKHVGFPTKKGVNPLLYDMQKRGVIRRVQESPPLWQLIVTATNSGPGGYLQAGSGAGPRGNKPLSPAALLRGTEDGQFHAPGAGEPPHPWKRPRFDTNTSAGSFSGIPSLLDLEPGQIGPNTMNYNSSMQQYPRKDSKNESVRTILTTLNAQRKGGSAQAHAPSGTGSDFKPPPSPMEMLHGGAAGAAGYQTTASSSPFTSSVVPSSKFSATYLSNHTHNVPKRAPPGGGGGGSGIASWLSTPTRPSWMKSPAASAEATGVSLNSNRPAAAQNVSSLLQTTSQGVQSNTTASQRVSPTPPRQNAKKIQSVNSLLKQINANRKGAYSPQPGAATPTTSTSAGNEKFVPPPSPAELLSQAGAPQLTAPPTAQPPMGRLSPNMMAQQTPSVGNGRGALLAGLQSSHGNVGRPPGVGSIGLGVGLTTAGIKGSDASAKFAGNFFTRIFLLLKFAIFTSLNSMTCYFISNTRFYNYSIALGHNVTLTRASRGRY